MIVFAFVCLLMMGFFAFYFLEFVNFVIKFFKIYVLIVPKLV